VIDFIRALAVWIEKSKTSQQSILLLIDDLAEFVYWHHELSGDLQKILMYGSTPKI